ncbi:hypothetical protein, partial [Mesorhizobium sp. M4A.F.Ca.ET.050.02.1.1]|uniref:hypothetical protein n=1 Tax=Mesorhizobium sp. M4A.F.Ca.ET.050.02.1.1 TaxID=2496754 RepID=UPI001AEC806C
MDASAIGKRFFLVRRVSLVRWISRRKSKLGSAKILLDDFAVSSQLSCLPIDCEQVALKQHVPPV